MGGKLIIGLMSGTSHDGIDAASVEITGSGIAAKASLIRHTTTSYPPSLARALHEPGSLDSKSLCALNAATGEAFAKAALKCAQKSGIAIRDLHAIASHGQTIWHIPPRGGRMGSTMQIGEPAVIARRTGVMVVSGFRAADMAEGGQGAPLVPYVDWLLLRGNAPVIAHNLGGISNLTLVTENEDDVTAFDTGPANSLMDAAMRMMKKGSFDRGGRLAKTGRVNSKALRWLMRNPYLRKAPPKSTGRELFGNEMTRKVMRMHNLRGADLMATLAEFTALSIADAYRRFVLPRAEARVAVFSGGGTRNDYLISRIRELVAPVEVRLSDEFGVPALAKEAFAFALLGNETLSGNTANLPSVTGARRRVILGSVTLP